MSPVISGIIAILIGLLINHVFKKDEFLQWPASYRTFLLKCLRGTGRFVADA
jgi:hypothetical protein